MNKKTVTKILVVSIITFLGSVLWMSYLNIEAEVLMAEIESKHSTDSKIARIGKSFFDGFTLGAFTKEGMFEEVYKLERWQDDVRARATRLKSQYSLARFLAFGSVFVCVGSGFGLYALNQKKT